MTDAPEGRVRGVERAAIRGAFEGVRLGSGVSLRQSAASYAYGEGSTGPEFDRAEFDRLPASEVTDGWERVPDADMRRGAPAYLDRDGLRYYLPALMLWLLDRYDDEVGRLDDMAFDLDLIGTMGWIAPGQDSRAHVYAVLDTFSPEQRTASATYVEALPRLVTLWWRDATVVERSIRDYWGRFLPPPG